ncbi:MAG: GTP-binding protein [bacterium]
MRLLILSGFLGSGKTTLLLKVARRFTDAGLKVAIIENEAGMVGIDDRIVAAEGFEVRELYSGCICCSLQLDLVRTLALLEAEVHPQVVILEPSGVAAPAAVTGAFRLYSGKIERQLLVVLADLPRLEKLIGKNLPFFETAVQAGELIALTKADAAPDELREKAFAEIARLNPQAPVFALSALTGAGLPEFLEAVAGRLLDAAATIPASRQQIRGVRPDAVVCAETADIAADTAPFDAAHLTKSTAALIAGLVTDLRRNEREILGHIKAVLEAPGIGYVTFSFTGPEAEPQCKGGIGGPIRQASLRVNAILCGVPEPELAMLLQARMAEWRQVTAG